MERNEQFYHACDLDAADKVITDIMSETRVLFTLCRKLSLSNLVVDTDDKGGEATMDLTGEVLSFGFKLRRASKAIGQIIRATLLDDILHTAAERAWHKEETPEQA